MINKKEERIKSFLFNFLLIINVPLRQEKKYYNLIIEPSYIGFSSVGTKSVKVYLSRDGIREQVMIENVQYETIPLGSGRLTARYYANTIEITCISPHTSGGAPTSNVNFTCSTSDGTKNGYVSVGWEG